MGDSFFKIFFFGMFGLLMLVGLIMFLQMEKSSNDSREQSLYLQSRGQTKIPSSWRSEIGKGI